MSNKFVVTEEQLNRLKSIAVEIRGDILPQHLGAIGYSIEAVIAEVETTPIDPSDEELYGEQSDEDDEEEPRGGSDKDL